MSDSSPYVCGICHAPNDDVASPCGACGAWHVFCANDDCGQIIPQTKSECPSCGTVNEEAAAFAAYTTTPPANAAPRTAVQSAATASSDAQRETQQQSPLLAALAAIDGSSSSSTQNQRPAAYESSRAGLNPPVSVTDPAGMLPTMPTIPEIPQIPELPAIGMNHDPALLEKSAHAAMAGVNGAIAGLQNVMPALGRLHVPGMLGGQSANGASAGSACIALWADTGGALKVGQRGLIKLRVTAHAMRQPADVRVVLQAGWETRPRVLPAFRLAPGAHHDLQPLRVHPSESGVDAIIVRIEADGVDGMPLERSNGTIDVHIEAPEQPAKTSDVGGMLRAIHEMIGPANANQRQAGWQPIDLGSDPSLQERLAATIPLNATLGSYPDAGYRRVTANEQRFNGCICHRPDAAGPVRTVLLAMDHSAAFGRGGDAAVCWWVRPAPFDDAKWKRISRRHCHLELDESRAWITDTSANGTALNGEMLTPQLRRVLADGDRISLAGAVDLTVRLIGDGNEVSVVCLHREDHLAGRITYVMCSGAVPVDVQNVRSRSGPAVITFFVEAAEKDSDELRLRVLHLAHGDWKPFAEANTSGGGSADVQWKRLPQPVDQQVFA